MQQYFYIFVTKMCHSEHNQRTNGRLVRRNELDQDKKYVIGFVSGIDCDSLCFYCNNLFGF